MKQSFEVWFDENEELLNIECAESGADRELDFDFDNFAEDCYYKYLNKGTNMIIDALKLFKKGNDIDNIKAVIEAQYSTAYRPNTPMIIEKSIEMVESLNVSIDKAGGRVPLDYIVTASFIDIIRKFGCNGIRFVHDKTENQSYAQLRELQKFCIEMKNDFKEQIDANDTNVVAAFGMQVYDEILNKLDIK